MGLWGKTESLPKEILNDIALDESQKIILWKKGTYSDWVLCTNKKVIILKKGLMTGHTLFQIPYENIEGASVNYNIIGGYFEVSGNGTQDLDKIYKNKGKDIDPKQAPNCVILNGKELESQFKEICTFINEKSYVTKRPKLSAEETASPIPDEILYQLNRYEKLLNNREITYDEYVKLKASVLAKI